MLINLIYLFYGHFNLVHYWKKPRKVCYFDCIKNLVTFYLKFSLSSIVKGMELVLGICYLSCMWKADYTVKPLFFVKNKGKSLWT